MKLSLYFFILMFNIAAIASDKTCVQSCYEKSKSCYITGHFYHGVFDQLYPLVYSLSYDRPYRLCGELIDNKSENSYVAVSDCLYTKDFAFENQYGALKLNLNGLIEIKKSTRRLPIKIYDLGESPIKFNLDTDKVNISGRVSKLTFGADNSVYARLEDSTSAINCIETRF